MKRASHINAVISHLFKPIPANTKHYATRRAGAICPGACRQVTLDEGNAQVWQMPVQL